MPGNGRPVLKIPPKWNHITPLDVCYKGMRETSQTELQLFSDASMYVYGAAAYLHVLGLLGIIHCSFVMSKSKLALKRQMRILRLALCIAVCVTNPGCLIQRGIRVKFDDVISGLAAQ